MTLGKLVEERSWTLVSCHLRESVPNRVQLQGLDSKTDSIGKTNWTDHWWRQRCLLYNPKFTDRESKDKRQDVPLTHCATNSTIGSERIMQGLEKHHEPCQGNHMQTTQGIQANNEEKGAHAKPEWTPRKTCGTWPETGGFSHIYPRGYRCKSKLQGEVKPTLVERATVRKKKIEITCHRKCESCTLSVGTQIHTNNQENIMEVTDTPTELLHDPAIPLQSSCPDTLDSFSKAQTWAP